MPLDAARWQIEIAAADRTAPAFASVDKRLHAVQRELARLNSTMASGGAGARGAAQEVAAIGTGAMAASRGVSGLIAIATRLAPVLGPAAVAWAAWNAGMKSGALLDQADQLGVTVEGLQAYRAVAMNAGVGTEQLDSAVIKLTGAMGAAKGGSAEMIASFDRLGVKLLDNEKQLRPIEEILPEVARGLLAVSSASERNALAQDVLGAKGQRLVSMLPQLAKGTDALTDAARTQGMLVERDTAEAWNKLDTQLKITKASAEATLAAVGAPIATWAAEQAAGVMSRLAVALRNARIEGERLSKMGFEVDPSTGGAFINPQELKAAELRRELGKVDTLLKHPARAGATEGNNRLLARRKALDEQLTEVNRQLDTSRQIASAEGMVEGLSPSFMPQLPPTGAGQPTAKGGGGSDPYAKAIESAREYTAQKNAETAAIGLGVQEAARLTHQQELLNKASTDATKLGPQQVATLKALAAAMAEADANFASAKFLDDFNRKAQEFIAQQQIERDTLYMSQQAALAYRLEQEAINKAKAEGIALTPGYVAQIRELAAAQAAAAEETRRAREWAEFEKATFKGFFQDFRTGLMQGKNAWDAFGNAGLNALNKIADKLLDIALNALWEQAFPGGIASGLGSLFGSSASSAFSGSAAAGAASSFGSGPVPVGAFAAGGETPVGLPYLVGERGPEVRVDRRPGTIFNRRQWMAGIGGERRSLDVRVSLDNELLRAVVVDESGKVVARATPTILSAARDQVVPTVEMHRQQRGGEY